MRHVASGRRRGAEGNAAWTEATLPHVLCVDDDPLLLESLPPVLHQICALTVALGPAEGLAALAAGGPYRVVISDMKMPEMDGSMFLEHVRLRSPASARVLLTGASSIEEAARAVNQGGLFRLLTKPCPPELLRATLLELFAATDADPAEPTAPAEAPEDLPELSGLAPPAAAEWPQRLDLREVAEEVIHTLRTSGRSESMQLELELPPGEAAVAIGRREAELMLFNVIRNAIDNVARTNRQSPAVSVAITTQESDGVTICRVTDNAAVLASEPGKEVANLRLGVARRTVEAAGGTVALAPIATGGNVLTVTLPSPARARAARAT